MKPTVYVETSVISYLVGRINVRNAALANRQLITRTWWRTRRHEVDVVSSTVVLEEVSYGNPVLAAERQALLIDVPLLRPVPEAHVLKESLIGPGAIPRKAETDAVHIAIAAVHGIEFLVTWNCRHIANAITIETIEERCRNARYEPPVICTPYEIFGDNPGAV